MTAVIHLVPGDRVDGATCITQTRHPLDPRLQLVVWRLDDGRLRLDGLAPGDRIGPVELASDAVRDRRLRQALIGEAART